MTENLLGQIEVLTRERDEARATVKELGKEFDSLLEGHWYILRNWSVGIKPEYMEAKLFEEKAKGLHLKRLGGWLS